jgi:hypothetical protein
MKKSAGRLRVIAVNSSISAVAVVICVGCTSASSGGGTPSYAEPSLGGMASIVVGASAQGNPSTSQGGIDKWSSSSGGFTAGSAGASGQGGASGAGGVISSSANGGSRAGSTATGGNAGSNGTGGKTSATGGKTSATGGKTSSSATGGKTGSGGVSGAGTGGTSVTSGASGATSNTGGANSTGGQLSAVGTGSLTLSNLKVEANPNNVLSAYVSWTTTGAANSVVQFGQGTYQFEIADQASVTSHKVLVIGMRASKQYKIKAISTNSSGSGQVESNFTTGSLPSQISAGTVPINDTTKSQAGWTLMNVEKGDGSTLPTSNYPAMAVMYDSEGQPVWYYINGTNNDVGGAISVDLTDKGVMIGPVADSSGATKEPPREVDFAGNTIWQCSDVNCGNPDGLLSHHAGNLSNGDYVILRWLTVNNNLNPVFEEITPDNRKVWSLDYGKLVPMPSGLSGDWCHGNSITIDIANNAVYANCRWMGLIKTTYTNPNTLVWHLPASYHAKGLGSITFSPTTSQYSDTHDPDIHSDGTILFFDNGGYDDPFAYPPVTSATHHSRALEYKIDEKTKTATLVWEFPGSFTVDTWYKNTWYTPFWGDADRLANGNVLITAGARGSSSESRIFEVTKQDGKVVWEFHLGPDIGVYRSDRITPPLVHAITQ